MNGIPKTMKALVAYSKTDYRYVEDLPVPECGPDDILIKTEAVSYTHLRTRQCMATLDRAVGSFRKSSLDERRATQWILWLFAEASAVQGYFKIPVGSRV